MLTTEILVVEDDPDFTLIADMAFEKADIAANVCFVADGLEAMEHLNGAFARKTHVPHLIFLDVKLPKHDGFEVLEWVRQQPKTRWTPVVMLTSSDHQSDIRRAYDLGANSYLLKPPSFGGMVDLIKKLHHYWLELNQSAD